MLLQCRIVEEFSIAPGVVGRELSGEIATEEQRLIAGGASTVFSVSFAKIVSKLGLDGRLIVT